MILGSYSEKAFTDLEAFREQAFNLVLEIEASDISLLYAIGNSYSYYCKKEPNTVIMYLAFMSTMQTQKFISSYSLNPQQKNILAIRNKELFIELITLYKCYKELDFQSFLSLFYFEEENRSKLTIDLLNIFLGYNYLDFATQNIEQEAAIEFLEGVFTASIEKIYIYIFNDVFLDAGSKKVVIPELSTLSLLWKGKISEERLEWQLKSELGKFFEIQNEQEQRVKDLLIKHNLYEIKPVEYHDDPKDFLDQTIKILEAENIKLRKQLAAELRKKLDENKKRFNDGFDEEQQKIHKQVMDSIANQSATIRAQIEQNYRANLNAAEQAYREESRIALTTFVSGIGRSIRLGDCTMFDRPSSGISASFSLSGSEGAKFNVSVAHGGRVGVMDFAPGAAQYARWQQVLYNKAQYAQIDAALNEARWKSIYAPEEQIEQARGLISQIGKLS